MGRRVASAVGMRSASGDSTNGSSASAASARPSAVRHLERRLRLVRLQLARLRDLVELLPLLEREVGLPDVLDEAVRARPILRRFVFGRIAEDEIAIEILLPLLHLPLE